jgi:alpha-L-fucosidase
LQNHDLRSSRLDWYLQAKFGLFLHWGPYSLAGVEASWPIMTPEMAEIMFHSSRRITQAEYTALPARFNPVGFDPRAWVRLACEAGMNYIILTAKHHDGFCMFDAPGTDYKITNTPYGRDICLEFAEACAAEGMRFGFYYSPPDMHHPGYRDTHRPVTRNWLGEPESPGWASYLDTMESHLRKLLSDYGEVSILWFDGLANHQKFDPPRFHRLIHELSPNTLINDRLGDGYDFITPEQFIPRKGIPVRSGKPPATNQGGDWMLRAVPNLLRLPVLGGWIRSQLKKYSAGGLELTQVPQALYPPEADFQPWETCMTMGNSWAFNPDESGWKSTRHLLRSLVEVASRGGNLLLNIGPAPDGAFPDEAVERLKEMGVWLAANGDGIFGTHYARPLSGFSGPVTAKAGCFFLHILDWPDSGQIVIENFPTRVKHVALLDGNGVSFLQEAGKLVVDLSPGDRAPDPVDTILLIECQAQ